MDGLLLVQLGLLVSDASALIAGRPCQMVGLVLIGVRPGHGWCGPGDGLETAFCSATLACVLALYLMRSRSLRADRWAAVSCLAAASCLVLYRMRSRALRADLWAPTLLATASSSLLSRRARLSSALSIWPALLFSSALRTLRALEEEEENIADNNAENNMQTTRRTARRIILQQ